jgi:hypothetical protein
MPRTFSKTLLAAMAGLAHPCAAQVQSGSFHLRDAGPQLVPLMVARAELINGVPTVTGPWVAYEPPAAGPDIPDIPVFDCFEINASGQPTGFCTSGCNQAGECLVSPQPAASTRIQIFSQSNPFCTNDMTVRSGYEGAISRRALAAWSWGAAVPTPEYVAIFTAEEFRSCALGPPSSTGGYAGVVYSFGAQTGGGGYHWMDVDLSAGPANIFHQMPMDGQGAYTIMLARAVDPVTNQLTLETSFATEPMLWGTGNGEVPPDGRFGSQGPPQWDDNSPTNGQHTASECVPIYSFTGVCPNPLGAMVLFFGGGATPPGCYANCDQSTTAPVLNVGDFTCFLQRFAAGESYANCDESTTPPVLNVGDFTCFLQRFAAGCP